MLLSCPGDGCDAGVSLLDRLDHSLLGVTDCRIARISDAALEHMMSHYPKIRAAMQWATLQREAIFREWIVSLGQRSAICRLSHLFCELNRRTTAIGLNEGDSFLLPLTQTDLGDALGLSTVHVNRSLQELRARELIAFGSKRLTIYNLAELEELAGIDYTYLHLDARYDAPLASKVY